MWVEKIKDDKIYYENTSTGELALTKPDSYQVPEEGVDHSVEVALQEGDWTERTSKAGKTYYWNEKDGKATWDLQRHLREMKKTIPVKVKEPTAAVVVKTPTPVVTPVDAPLQVPSMSGTPATVSLAPPAAVVSATDEPIPTDEVIMSRTSPADVTLPPNSPSLVLPPPSAVSLTDRLHHPVASPEPQVSAEQQIASVKEEQKVTQAQLSSVIREYDHAIRIAPDWVLKKTVAQRKEALHRAEVALMDIQRSIGPHGVLPLTKPPVVSPEPPSIAGSPRFPRFAKPQHPPFGSFPSVTGRSQSPARIASPIAQILRPAIEPPPSSVESRAGWSMIEEEAWKQLACLNCV